jgi:DNA invertase Pin-like site-specific DNA recombinase
MDKNNKAIIVVRVNGATQENKNDCIPNQVRILEEYCKKKDLEIVDSVVEVQSGHKSSVLGNLIEKIKENEGKIIICVQSFDRFTRNISDPNITKLLEMARCSKIEIHSVLTNEVFGNIKSASEQFKFDMGSILTRCSSDAISDYVKRALEQKRQNGEWANKAPFGYINTTDIDGKKTIVIDESKVPLIQDIFNLYSSGNLSLNDILKALRIIYPDSAFETKKKLTRTFIYRIIKNKDFYSGYITHNGKRYPHKYEHIISLTNPK